jgi:hypothetical protein
MGFSSILPNALKLWKRTTRRPPDQRPVPLEKPVLGTGKSSNGFTTTLADRRERESIKSICPPSPSSSPSVQQEREFGTKLSTPLIVPSHRSSFQQADSDLSTCSKPTLRDELCNARIEWPEGSFRYFIPEDALNEIVTPESISVELARYGLEFASDELRQETARKISKVAPKLFAILVCLKQGRHILEFLDESIDDVHLPFVRSDKHIKSRHFKLCSKKSPNRPIKCMMAWDQARINDFGRDQWCMFAPIFEYRDEIEHYDLDDNCVLPWIEDDERSDRAIEGGYGSVWKIAIHPAHQRVIGSANQKVMILVP